MTPPNFGSGGGICFPSIVVVALGEPGVPVVWTCDWTGAAAATRSPEMKRCCSIFITVLSSLRFLQGEFMSNAPSVSQILRPPTCCRLLDLGRTNHPWALVANRGLLAELCLLPTHKKSDRSRPGRESRS